MALKGEWGTATSLEAAKGKFRVKRRERDALLFCEKGAATKLMCYISWGRRAKKVPCCLQAVERRPKKCPDVTQVAECRPKKCPDVTQVAERRPKKCPEVTQAVE